MIMNIEFYKPTRTDIEISLLPVIVYAYDADSSYHHCIILSIFCFGITFEW